MNIVEKYIVKASTWACEGGWKELFNEELHDF